MGCVFSSRSGNRKLKKKRENAPNKFVFYPSVNYSMLVFVIQENFNIKNERGEDFCLTSDGEQVILQLKKIERNFYCKKWFPGHWFPWRTFIVHYNSTLLLFHHSADVYVYGRVNRSMDLTKLFYFFHFMLRRMGD
jgi:hypothetical protein